MRFDVPIVRSTPSCTWSMAALTTAFASSPVAIFERLTRGMLPALTRRATPRSRFLLSVVTLDLLTVLAGGCKLRAEDGRQKSRRASLRDYSRSSAFVVGLCSPHPVDAR